MYMYVHIYKYTLVCVCVYQQTKGSNTKKAKQVLPGLASWFLVLWTLKIIWVVQAMASIKFGLRGQRLVAT